MKYSLLSALVLVGAVAACSDSTSPMHGRSTPGVLDASGNSVSDTTQGHGTTPPPVVWPGSQTPGSGPNGSCGISTPVQSDEWGGIPVEWQSTPESRDTLWFIDVAPQFAGVDVYVDAMQIWHDQGFSSGYSGLFVKNNSASQMAVVTATSNPTKVLASAQMTLGANRSTILVFIQRSGTSGGLIVLYDTVSAPPSGYTSFRLLNAAPNASGAVDVYETPGMADPTDQDARGPTLAGLTPAASNVSFGEMTRYISSPAGPFHIIVTRAGDPNAVLYDDGPENPTAGHVSTIILMNNACDTWPLVSPLFLQDR